MSSLEMKRTLSERDQVRGHALGGTVLPDTEFTHDSIEQKMLAVVTGLIDSREDSYGMNTKEANELLSGQPAENFLRSSRQTPAHAHVPGLATPFADSIPTYSNQMLYPSQPLNGQSQESTIQSAQLADARSLNTTTGPGFHGHRNQVPQFSTNTPIHSGNTLSGQISTSQTRHPEMPGGFLTPSELDYHVELFKHPFSSSWGNKSSIFAGTNTPYRSNANARQHRVSPTYPVGGHYRQSSPLTGAVFESSEHGIYGDSRSYEREMMLQSSFAPLSGSTSQMQMQTPPGGQG